MTLQRIVIRIWPTSCIVWNSGSFIFSVFSMYNSFFVNIYYNVLITFGHRESHQLVYMYYYLFTFLTLVHSHSLFKPNGQFLFLEASLTLSCAFILAILNPYTSYTFHSHQQITKYHELYQQKWPQISLDTCEHIL